MTPDVRAAVDTAPVAIAHGGLLVASDGFSGADAAFSAAVALAKTLAIPVSAVGVVPPYTGAAPEGGPIPLPPAVDELLTAELRDGIAKQVATVTAASTAGQWPVEILHGPPPVMIAGRARELGARAIVLGLGRHDVVSRVFGTETALQVLRLSETPVLAVGASWPRAPRRAVIGIDFSQASLEAARLALSFFPDLEHVDLVHVMPVFSREVAGTPLEAQYQVEVTDAFARYTSALAVPPRVQVHTLTPTGTRPAETILAQAAQVDADIVAVGSHGRGFISRLIVGSVATGVIRGAQRAVLAVPTSTPK